MVNEIWSKRQRLNKKKLEKLTNNFDIYFFSIINGNVQQKKPSFRWDLRQLETTSCR